MSNPQDGAGGGNPPGQGPPSGDRSPDQGGSNETGRDEQSAPEQAASSGNSPPEERRTDQGTRSETTPVDQAASTGTSPDAQENIGQARTDEPTPTEQPPTVESSPGTENVVPVAATPMAETAGSSEPTTQHHIHHHHHRHRASSFMWQRKDSFGRIALRSMDFLVHGADFEAAISAAGFGRFHYCLLALTGLIYTNTAIGITIVSFVLPAATCDFRMTSADKGLLTATPMFGMVLGSYFWGCLADTKGRKAVLISTLLLDGICGIISSAVQYFSIFLICRFFNGFAVAGAMGICFPYLGEFQQTKHREKILCWMEMFWTLGVILLPLIAWAIIPISGIRIQKGSFTYDSWNWFVAACGVPSILLGCWLFIFPESPKFMMECGDYDEALDVFENIYELNTGDSPENFPIKSLRERVRTASITSQDSDKSIRTLSIRKRKDLKRLFDEIWYQTKALCRPPFLKYTILTCIIQFGLTTSYYTLMIWFPELFNRYELYENLYPKKSASVCDVSTIHIQDDTPDDPFDCEKKIDTSVYVHTLIVGLACIPTSLWLPLCVHRLGAKFFLIFSLAVSGMVTVGLYFVRNSTENLVLSCIFEALTSLAISLVFCVLVDLFPTNLRVMAAALSLTAGRGGGLIGNLGFGYLIDINCIVPIVIFSTLLFIAAILCFFLPKTGQEALD